jgi:hypothetical protein
MTMANYALVEYVETEKIWDNVCLRFGQSLHHGGGELPTITLLYATPTGTQEATLRHRGWPAVAITRVTPLRHRVNGVSDATIELDLNRWDKLTEDEKVACLHHELHSIHLKREKDGKPKYDDSGRPQLRIKEHDFQVGGFWEVIETHGEAALEMKLVRQIAKGDLQGRFKFAFDNPNSDEPEGDEPDEEAMKVAAEAPKKKRGKKLAPAPEADLAGTIGRKKSRASTL